MNKKAFSFLELLIVLAILGLIAALSIPAAQNVRSKIRTKIITEQLENIVNVGKSYCEDMNLKKVSFKTLKDEKKIEDIHPILGESYNDLIIESSGGELNVKTSTGNEVILKY